MTVSSWSPGRLAAELGLAESQAAGEEETMKNLSLEIKVNEKRRRKEEKKRKKQPKLTTSVKVTFSPWSLTRSLTARLTTCFVINALLIYRNRCYIYGRVWYVHVQNNSLTARDNSPSLPNTLVYPPCACA